MATPETGGIDLGTIVAVGVAALTALAAWVGAITGVRNHLLLRRTHIAAAQRQLQFEPADTAAGEHGRLVVFRPELSGGTYEVLVKVPGAKWEPVATKSTEMAKQIKPGVVRFPLFRRQPEELVRKIRFAGSKPGQSAHVKFQIVEAGTGAVVVGRKVRIA